MSSCLWARTTFTEIFQTDILSHICFMNFESVKKLREKIPIGISDAIKILTENNFDVERAAKDWEEKTMKSFIGNTNVSESDAVLYLKKYEWDLRVSIQKFQEEQMTATERVLASYQSPQSIVTVIARIIELERSKQNSSDGYANESQKKFWGLYYCDVEIDYERCDAGGMFAYYEVLDFIKEIGLPELAERFANDSKSPESDPVIRRARHSFYLEQQETIYQKMVEYVIAHKSEFPK
jgi:hypothetical protein